MTSGAIDRDKLEPRASASTIAYLLSARALRDFGDGFVAVLLPVYLTALGFSPLQVGVIATVALLGSALLTLGIGLIGARHDYRRLLLAAAGLMVATGVALSLVHDFALLLVVAFAGTANPSAGSVSVFVPLEHALLSRQASDRERTRMFARYGLIGAPQRRLRRARRGSSRLSLRSRHRPVSGHQGDVRALCLARRRRQPALCAHSKAAYADGGPEGGGLGPV